MGGFTLRACSIPSQSNSGTGGCVDGYNIAQYLNTDKYSRPVGDIACFCEANFYHYKRECMQIE